MDDKIILEITELNAGYVKDGKVLRGVDLTIYENEIVAIVGQNGAGKSTLAKAIMCLIPYTSGSVKFNNDELINRRKYSVDEIVNKGISYFAQGGEIFPNLTVEENLRFAGIMLDGKNYKKILNTTKNYFDLFKDNNRIKMKASYLSGGEKHQLALAMILLRKPKFLILDEPSAGLSPTNRKMIFQIINRLKDELKLSILLIEQNVVDASKIADRMCLLRLGIITKRDKTKNIKELDKFFWN